MEVASTSRIKRFFGVSVVFVAIMTLFTFYTFTYGNVKWAHDALRFAVNVSASLVFTITRGNKSTPITNVAVTQRNSTTKYVIVAFNKDSSPLQYYNETLANRCAYSNCILSRDKTNLRNQSAILFFLTDAPGLPPKPPLSPSERNPDQVWIFSWLESPILHHGGSGTYKNPHWRNTVNWTMSYIHDADIDLPYGHLIKQPPAKQPVPARNYSEIFHRKTKLAAWVVSHCHTQSKREVYVEKLKKAGIRVDIFGRCSGKPVEKDFVRRLIDREYKFYLAFENAFCEDYITEKFFSYFQLDIIPVVRGGGNYSNTSTDRTYINTADFSSIKALAEYLKKVASSEELFTEYLRKKDKYSSPERLELRARQSYCEVCKRLNNLQSYRKTYTNLVHKINDGTCFEPNDLN